MAAFLEKSFRIHEFGPKEIHLLPVARRENDPFETWATFMFYTYMNTCYLLTVADDSETFLALALPLSPPRRCTSDANGLKSYVHKNWLLSNREQTFI